MASQWAGLIPTTVREDSQSRTLISLPSPAYYKAKKSREYGTFILRYWFDHNYNSYRLVVHKGTFFENLFQGFKSGFADSILECVDFQM